MEYRRGTALSGNRRRSYLRLLACEGLDRSPNRARGSVDRPTSISTFAGRAKDSVDTSEIFALCISTAPREKSLVPVREIGMVFQTSNLLPWRNLLQNIRFPFEIMREDPEHYRDRIDDLIEITALKGFEHHYPRELSGGMQQRASIVRAGTQEYMTSICPAPARYPLPPNLIFLKSSPKSNRPFSMTYRTMPRQPDESRRRAAAVTEYVELPPLANGSTHVY